MKKVLIVFLRIVATPIWVTLGLILCYNVVNDIWMARHFFVEKELHRMGLYYDFPDFPSYRISGFKHRWRRIRYDYTLKLDNPLSEAAIARIDSLSNSPDGWYRWYHDEKGGRYILFLWDVAGEDNDFLIIRPEKTKKLKFVYEPPHPRMTIFKAKHNDDLFYGPVPGPVMKVENP